jgi:PPOX class probable F420-dependent enzyme
VLRLATAGHDGQPHLIPCTFTLAEDASRVAIGIDHKPKTSTNLRRLRNIGENSRVSLMVDHYADDWERLWWVRADGTASITYGGDDHTVWWAALRRKYPQYTGVVLDGPVIVVAVESWTGWAFAEEG